MTDNADIVREFIQHAAEIHSGSDDALAALDALEAEIRSLNEQVVGAVDLLEGAVAERDNAVAKGQSRLRCWLFGHDWKRREWHVLGTCDRCGKKEAGS